MKLPAASLRRLRRAAAGMAAAATLLAAAPAVAAPAPTPEGATHPGDLRAGSAPAARTGTEAQAKAAVAVRAVLPRPHPGHRHPAHYLKRAPATVGTHSKRPGEDAAVTSPARGLLLSLGAALVRPAPSAGMGRDGVVLAARAPPARQ